MTTTYYARNDVLYSGGDKLFSITFSYIKKEHIKVFVNDEETDNFTFNNDSQILINDNIAVGDLVSIRRNTPIDTRMVVFSDTSILNKDNQNLAQTQMFDVVQEMKDENTAFQINVEDIISDFEGDTNTAIEAIETIANTAKSNSETALEEAGTALSYSNAAVNTANAASTLASTANTNASNAVSTATTAATNASNAVSTANTANTNSQNAVSTANTASTNASSALEKANTAISTSNTALTNSQTAVSTANTASTNATNAVSTANTASSTASSAASTANEAKTTAETASDKVDTFGEDIADVLEAAEKINELEEAVATATTAATNASTAATNASNAATNASNAANTASTAAQTATSKAQEAVNAVASVKQPDWNQTDNTQKDFIKNKPTIPTATNVKINGTSITSGGVADILTNSAYSSETNKIATMSDIPSDEVFVATVNVTSYQDILTAYNAGKKIICEWVFQSGMKRITTNCSFINNEMFTFTFSEFQRAYYVYISTSSNTWFTDSSELAPAVATLQGSGTKSLTDNRVYTFNNPTGAVTFTLPTITDTTKLHQILVQLSMSTARTISLGTTYYFNAKTPDISTTGFYNIIYEYDNIQGVWIVGAIKKGTAT